MAEFNRGIFTKTKGGRTRTFLDPSVIQEQSQPGSPIAQRQAALMRRPVEGVQAGAVEVQRPRVSKVGGQRRISRDPLLDQAQAAGRQRAIAGGFAGSAAEVRRPSEIGLATTRQLSDRERELERQRRLNSRVREIEQVLARRSGVGPRARTRLQQVLREIQQTGRLPVLRPGRDRGRTGFVRPGQAVDQGQRASQGFGAGPQSQGRSLTGQPLVGQIPFSRFITPGMTVEQARAQRARFQ